VSRMKTAIERECHPDRFADPWPYRHDHSTDVMKQKRLATARAFRDNLLFKKGEACAPEVQRLMLDLVPELCCEPMDWRFLGVLFRGGDFEVVRYEKAGSHGRPVPIWRRK